ncbi:MAG: hypothetical protein AABX70_08460 [Nanoarchaeota archaeon]
MITPPLAQNERQKKFWDRFQPDNRCAASDTYKRTMSGSSDTFADHEAVYTLVARKALPEEGVNGRYIMAGLEKVLYTWFLNPILPDEVEEAYEFFRQHGKVKKFPIETWKDTLRNLGRMPIDIYALPGGQTFLVKDGKYTPLMSVEGTGALVSHLEPGLLEIWAPIIQATKARLFYEAVGEQFAEFGLRSEKTINDHVTLMLALYVGGGLGLTSNDLAVLRFPEYFQDIGTVGHEYIMSFQREGISLEEAQRLAFEEFVQKNQRSALLPDVIDTVRSGLPDILDLVRKYEGQGKIIMPRFDSGDVPQQCVTWKRMMLAAGIPATKMVVEDGYTPSKARETQRIYAAAGFDPVDIIVGAGGYFQEGASRDAGSFAYKRSATKHGDRFEPGMKFSDSPGKESIPGRVRVYGKGNQLIVAQADEEIDGEPLMQKVVGQGRIEYNEDLRVQRERAERTWGQYTEIVYSPQTLAIMESRRAERRSILGRLGG